MLHKSMKTVRLFCRIMAVLCYCYGLSVIFITMFLGALPKTLKTITDVLVICSVFFFLLMFFILQLSGKINIKDSTTDSKIFKYEVFLFLIETITIAIMMIIGKTLHYFSAFDMKEIFIDPALRIFMISYFYMGIGIIVPNI